MSRCVSKWNVLELAMIWYLFLLHSSSVLEFHLEFDSQGLPNLMKKENNFFFSLEESQPFCRYDTLNLNISNNPCDLRTFRLLCTALGMRKFQDIQIIFALSTNEKLLFFVVVELVKINKKYFFYLLLYLLESKQLQLLLMSQFIIMFQCLGKSTKFYLFLSLDMSARI